MNTIGAQVLSTMHQRPSSSHPYGHPYDIQHILTQMFAVRNWHTWMGDSSLAFEKSTSSRFTHTRIFAGEVPPMPPLMDMALTLTT